MIHRGLDDIMNIFLDRDIASHNKYLQIRNKIPL